MENDQTTEQPGSPSSTDEDINDENIPPHMCTNGLELKMQTEGLKGHSSGNPAEVEGPVSDNYAFSTPLPTKWSNGGMSKSSLSSSQLALTPISKLLNAAKKQSPRSHFSGSVCASLQKSSGNFSHHHTLDSSSFAMPLGTTNRPFCILDFEYLPEITLLDDTYNSTMQLTSNDSAHLQSTPATRTHCNETTQSTENLVDSLVLPEHITTSACVKDRKEKKHPEEESSPAPIWLLEKHLPEITLLDVSRDSELSPGVQTPCPDGEHPMTHSETRPSREPVAEPGPSETVSFEEVSCSSLQTIKASLEATQDGTLSSTLENNKLSEPSEQSVENPQSSAEDTLPVNVTRDLSSSRNLSFTQLSASAVECCASTQADELSTIPETAQSSKDELLLSHDTELASEVSNQSLTKEVSMNNTHSVLQPGGVSVLSVNNITLPICCNENKTFDLTTADSGSLSKENSVTNEKTAKALQLHNGKSSFLLKESSRCLVAEPIFEACTVGIKSPGSGVAVTPTPKSQSDTFNCKPVAGKSNTFTFSEISLSETHHKSLDELASPVAPKSQNDTFECKPCGAKNNTLTLSEGDLSETHRKSLDKPTSPTRKDLTTSLKEEFTPFPPLELLLHGGVSASTKTGATVVENPNIIFKATPPLTPVSEKAESQKDHSQSELAVVVTLSDSSRQSLPGYQNSKRTSFNLDESLDFKPATLITSTPMTTWKFLDPTHDPDRGRMDAAQKKLYQEGLDSQSLREPPSNIVSDRKTFLTRVPSRPATHLHKGKSIIPRKPPSLPVKRNKASGEGSVTPVPSEDQATPATSTLHSLHPKAVASKLPTSGLTRPQTCGIPLVMHRTAAALKPPTVTADTQGLPSADKPFGTKSANPGIKMLLGKKHTLLKGEVVLPSKKKKIDVPVASKAPDAASSASGLPNGVRSLKLPTAGQKSLPSKSQKSDVPRPVGSIDSVASSDVPCKSRSLKPPATAHKALPIKVQNHGCSKCSELEEQLKLKTEEIKRLKEELGKYNKEENSRMIQ